MEYDKTIPKCPICKSIAFIAHDFVCGYDFGWSIGCPRACIADGIHGFDDYDSFHQAKLVLNALPTKEIAKKCWEERCKEREEAVQMGAEALKKRPHGKWTEEFDESANPFFRRRWRCSACNDYNYYGRPEFCPHCGAKMKEGGEE